MPSSSAGYYIEPTIFETKADARIARDEIFGAVLSVITFDTVEEAMKIANDSEYGLAAAVWASNLTTKPAIVEHARTILHSDAKMLTSGGDHYITYPLLIAHAEKYGQLLSLIHFDAHGDTWADDSPDSLNHGSMFYKAVKDGLIDPKTSVQVGIRTWRRSTWLAPTWLKLHPLTIRAKSRPSPQRTSRAMCCACGGNARSPLRPGSFDMFRFTQNHANITLDSPRPCH